MKAFHDRASQARSPPVIKTTSPRISICVMSCVAQGGPLPGSARHAAGGAARPMRQCRNTFNARPRAGPEVSRLACHAEMIWRGPLSAGARPAPRRPRLRLDDGLRRAGQIAAQRPDQPQRTGPVRLEDRPDRQFPRWTRLLTTLAGRMEYPSFCAIRSLMAIEPDSTSKRTWTCSPSCAPCLQQRAQPARRRRHHQRLAQRLGQRDRAVPGRSASALPTTKGSFVAPVRPARGLVAAVEHAGQIQPAVVQPFLQRMGQAFDHVRLTSGSSWIARRAMMPVILP